MENRENVENFIEKYNSDITDSKYKLDIKEDLNGAFNVLKYKGEIIFKIPINSTDYAWGEAYNVLISWISFRISYSSAYSLELMVDEYNQFKPEKNKLHIETTDFSVGIFKDNNEFLFKESIGSTDPEKEHYLEMFSYNRMLVNIFEECVRLMDLKNPVPSNN